MRKITPSIASSLAVHSHRRAEYHLVACNVEVYYHLVIVSSYMLSLLEGLASHRGQ